MMNYLSQDISNRGDKIECLMFYKKRRVYMHPESNGFKSNPELDSKDNFYECELWRDKELKNYKNYLHNLSDQELEVLCAELIKKEQAKQKSKEDSAFYNREDAGADYDYWSMCEYWSIEETTALSFGKNPKTVSSYSLQKTLSHSFANQYKDRKELLERKFGKDKKIKPQQFVVWAAEKKLQIPQGLKNLSSFSTTDWKAEHGKLQQTLEALQKELEVLKEKPKKSEKSLSTRERNTLLKILIGIAIEQYGYRPDSLKNVAAPQISDDLKTSGITVDPDTIRKYLKEAVEALPDGFSLNE